MTYPESPMARRAFFCETLESRQLLTASVGVDTHFGTSGAVTTAMESSTTANADFAYSGAQLSDGRLLVAGMEITGAGERNAFVLYNADGTLAKGFNAGNPLLQSIATSKVFGLVDDVKALPDGSALTISDGLHRLKADGTWDATFGTDGVIADNPISARVLSNGNIFVIEAVSGTGFRTRTYNIHGKPVGAASITVQGTPVPLSDGNIVSIQGTSQLTFYTSTLSKITTIGTAGIVALKAPLEAWLKSLAPWYNPAKLTGLPAYVVYNITTTRDGGYVVSGAAEGKHTAAAAPAGGSSAVSAFTIRISATGAVQSMKEGGSIANNDRTGVTFAPGNTYFGGVFHFGIGGDVTFNVPTRSGGIVNMIRAKDGSYYMLGATATPQNLGAHFTVVHTKPVVSKITGVVFSDTNKNGKYDADEPIGAGKQVFVDLNNNGKLDVGEPVATTDTTGRYTFTDLGPGTYHVRRILPTGYEQTTPITAVALNVGQSATFNIGSIAPTTTLKKIAALVLT